MRQSLAYRANQVVLGPFVAPFVCTFAPLLAQLAALDASITRTCPNVHRACAREGSGAATRKRR